MIKLKVTKGDPDPPASLSPKKMQEWNGYVDWLDKKGMKGHKDLDKKETGLAKRLFDEYVASVPNAELKYDDVKLVQQEMLKLKDTAQDFAKRHGDPNAANLMSGTSKVDGWSGSKTTQFKFPNMTSTDYNNGALTQTQNLGLVNGNLKTSNPMTPQRQLPSNAKLEKLQDGYYYENSDGDLVKWSGL